MPLNRRTFLGNLAAASGVLAWSRTASADLTTRALPAGVQLYTLRAEMQRDVPGTLAAVAAIGYREVEFAGYFGHTPAALRELLDRHRLSAPSVHAGLGELRRDAGAVFEAARVLGHHFITVPSLAAGERASKSALAAVARQLNEHGAAAQALGRRLAYHNHDFEFAPVDGVTAFDVLLGETDPELVSFQLDVYWAFRAGRDPRALLLAHPGRFSMLHLKDSAGPPQHAMLEVGAGVIDFAALLAPGPGLDVRHAFVEHDRPGDAVASVRASFEYLAGMR
jgi:sugar phosphate isomerase/epimerase